LRQSRENPKHRVDELNSAVAGIASPQQASPRLPQGRQISPRPATTRQVLNAAVQLPPQQGWPGLPQLPQPPPAQVPPAGQAPPFAMQVPASAPDLRAQQPFVQRFMPQHACPGSPHARHMVARGGGGVSGDGGAVLAGATWQKLASAAQVRPRTQHGWPVSPQLAQRPSMQTPPAMPPLVQAEPAGAQREPRQQPPSWQAGASRDSQQGWPGPPHRNGRHTRTAST